MTPKPDEPVLDVNVDEYSLNGTVLGKTATDISAIDSLLIEPLYKELRKTREQEQIEVLKTQQSADLAGKIKLHVDENLSYGDFYKSFVSIFWGGYSVFNIVIGSNYKDFFQLDIPIVDYDLCGFFIGEMKELRYKYLRNRQKLSLDEMSEIDVKDRECVEDHETLDLLLSFYRKDDGIAYVVSLNETFFNKGSRFDGYNFYTFNDENDLWKFIEDVRSRVERQTEKKPETKQDRVLRLLIDALDGPNKITLVFEKDVLMKDIAPIIKKLNTYGYRFVFSIAN